MLSAVPVPSQMHWQHLHHPQYVSQVCLRKPWNLKGNVMLSIQLGGLHVHVHFSVVDNIVVTILIETSAIHRFVKEIIPMERGITPVFFS